MWGRILQIRLFFCPGLEPPWVQEDCLFDGFFLSGARFPLCTGVGVGHIFLACVRRSRAMKNHYDETCGGQFISRRFWPFQWFFLFGARFLFCAGVGVGLFSWPAVRRSQAMKNHYDESRRFWFISRRLWPLNGSPLCAGVGVGHFSKFQGS